MTTAAASSKSRRSLRLHPMLMMLAMILAAIVLTHLVPAGKYDRHEGRVVAGSYRVLPKINGLPALVSPSAPSQSDSPAKAAGVVALFSAIPAGLTRAAALMFM